LPYRANPSYLAIPATASVDLGALDGPFTARVYAGSAVYFDSGIPEATHPDARVGVELRYGELEDTSTPPPPPPVAEAPAATRLSDFLATTRRYGLGRAHSPGEQTTSDPVGRRRGRSARRGARSYVLAYEALAQHKFAHDPASPGQPVFVLGSGHWLTHHAMAMLVFNLDTMRSTSNALALSLEYIDGRDQHGQLVEYHTIHAIAGAVSYYW
jgi:hypothetical protein